MRVRVKDGHSRAGAVGTVLKQECASEDGVVILTDSWFVHLDGEAAPRWIRRDALEPENPLPRVNARVIVIDCGQYSGKGGFVEQVDGERGELLVRLDGAFPLWLRASQLATVKNSDQEAAILRELKAQSALKAEIAAKEWAERMRKDVENLRRLVEAQKAGAPERYRIAPGWSDAGRIGSRVAPDVEVGGVYYVPLAWEDEEREIGSGVRPVFVPKCTLAPAVTPPPAPVKPKNERLRGMVYINLAGSPFLCQSGEMLDDAEYAEVVRRSNAWGALERLYQRICDSVDLTAPSVREELGRIVKGGV